MTNQSFSKTSQRFLVALLFILFASFQFTSCASTGPKVSRAERKQMEEEFNLKFLEASKTWLPRIYRVGYKLINSPVPDHGDSKPKFGFVGLGVKDLKDYARKAYGIDKSVKGILVQGVYRGSKAENVDVLPGDVIVKINGKKTKSLGSYFKKMRRASGPTLKAEIRRKGQTLTRELPVEKVYYNAQFFLAATPDLEATAAFSKINVGIGAIRYCRNDDELATLMGHELAHVSLKHSLKHMGVGVSTAIAYGALAGVVEAFTFPGVGSALIYPVQKAQEAAISRRYEREADYYGMLHAFHSGYNVENGSRVFSRLATDAPSFSLLAYTFASHPKNSERFLRLEKIVEELKTKYPGRIDGQAQSPEWELVIPVEQGETLDEALGRLIKQNQPAVTAAAATTSGKDTASPASPDIALASEYPAPRKS